MDSQNKINKEILDITMIIAEQFPELTKYLSETPIKLEKTPYPEINNKNLLDYYQTLKSFLMKYTLNHTQKF